MKTMTMRTTLDGLPIVSEQRLGDGRMLCVQLAEAIRNENGDFPLSDWQFEPISSMDAAKTLLAKLNGTPIVAAKPIQTKPAAKKPAIKQAVVAKTRKQELDDIYASMRARSEPTKPVVSDDPVVQCKEFFAQRRQQEALLLHQQALVALRPATPAEPAKVSWEKTVAKFSKR